jgi:hypothetical protein
MYTFSINEGYLKDRIEVTKIKFLPYILVFIVVFPFLFCVTMILPPLWNISFGTSVKICHINFSAYYSSFVSSYSLIDVKIDFGSDLLRPKLYLDVLVYYLFIYFLVASSLLIRFSPTFVRKFIYRRRLVPFASSFPAFL